MARLQPKPTRVYETLWRFACERQNIFYRRLAGNPPPWTSDPVLQTYRFTNVYRSSDRVTQYLIRNVIYRADLPSDPREVVFRIILFKLFNRIETWEHLENVLGPITLARFRFEHFAQELSRERQRGRRLYSAAYIMPSTASLGENVKHRGHLRLIERMMSSDVSSGLSKSRSMGEAFQLLLSFPTIGRFLAFQFVIDINYSEVIDFSEMDFVVPGPGAIDGLRKCFSTFGEYSEEDVIRWVTDRQEVEPAKLGLNFQMLYGRPLQLIDVQNLFCEVSKYARVAHPEIRGANSRTRLKQVYRHGPPPPRPFFPPKWNLKTTGPRL